MSTLLNYKGQWNAFLNQPVLSDGQGVQGDTYIIINNDPATGQQYYIYNRDLGSGLISWPASEYITYNGTTWELLGSAAAGSGTVTFIDISGSTGIQATGGPITTAGTFTILNTAPDQVVSLTPGTGIGISGTYPNFNISNTQSPGSTTLAGLSDVNITSPADGDLLKYDNATSKWINFINNFLINGTNSTASQVTLGSATATTNAILSVKNGSGPVGALFSGNGSANAVGAGSIGSGPYLQGYNSIASSTQPLYINPSGKNVILSSSGTNLLVGTSTDGGERFQVNGSVAFDLGSDATGDVFYRNSLGSLERLPIGSNGDLLTVATGLPAWFTPSYITGNQTITLSGDITGSGATAITTAIANGVVDIANLSATGTPGSSTYLRGDNTWATIAGGSPGGSSSQVQYNNSGSFDGASQVMIDSSDENLVLANTSGTTSPALLSGGAKLWSNARIGQGQLTITPDIGTEYLLQAAIGERVIGRFIPNGNTITADGHFLNCISTLSTSSALVAATYDATNLLPNKNYYRYTTGASTNQSAEIYMSTAGKGPIIGNALYGSGAKLTHTFGFQTAKAAMRFFSGYTNTTTTITSTVDPSALTNIIGFGKDQGDTNIQLMTNDGSGTATKTDTGLLAVGNQVYRVTILIPSLGSTVYALLEVFGKGTVNRYVSGPISSNIPAAGTLLYNHLYVNTGTTNSNPVALAFISSVEELFI